MRKPLLAGVAILLVLVGTAAWVVLPRPCPVNRAAYDRIEMGMTLTQVQEILGGPPGDYRTTPVDLMPPHERMRLGQKRPSFKVGNWEGDEGLVLVNFDGRVTWKEFVEPVRKPGMLEVLRWRLNRRWERLWGR